VSIHEQDGRVELLANRRRIQDVTAPAAEVPLMPVRGAIERRVEAGGRLVQEDIALGRGDPAFRFFGDPVLRVGGSLAESAVAQIDQATGVILVAATQRGPVRGFGDGAGTGGAPLLAHIERAMVDLGRSQVGIQRPGLRTGIPLEKFRGGIESAQGLPRPFPRLGGGLVNAGGRQFPVMIVRIQFQANTDLVEIIQAGGHPRLFFGPPQGRQHHAGQNGNDGHDDQELDQGKTGINPRPSRSADPGPMAAEYLFQVPRKPRPCLARWPVKPRRRLDQWPCLDDRAAIHGSLRCYATTYLAPAWDQPFISLSPFHCAAHIVK
jgi:hypothetical protein